MRSPLRLLDTGLASARRNIAMTAAMSELHRAGRIGDTLRFHVYPKSVLIGRHQVLAQAANMEKCRKRGVELARRVTGGGAVYMSPGILAWELLTSGRAAGMQLNNVAEGICGAVAAGLSRLGLPARYRALNEIEVGGRRICGASGYYDGATLVYQGTILIDPDFAEMADVLALPVLRGAKALKKRLVALSELLGHAPANGEIIAALTAGISDFMRRELAPGTVLDEEQALADQLFAAEYGNDDFVQGVDVLTSGSTIMGRQTAPESLVEAHIRTHPGAEQRIEQIWLTGNFSITPPRTLPDVEAALRGMPVLAASDRVLELLDDETIEMRGATRFDVAAAIANAMASKSAATTKAKPRGRRL